MLRSIPVALLLFAIMTNAQADTAIYQSYPGSPNGVPNTSAGAMWGTGIGSTGGGAALGSAQMHQLDGMNAGYEQAARKSLLMAPGNSITVQSIGNQTIVNTSIYGNNNTATIDSEFSSTNSGSINNSGAVSNTNNQ